MQVEQRRALSLLLYGIYENQRQLGHSLISLAGVTLFFVLGLNLPAKTAPQAVAQHKLHQAAPRLNAVEQKISYVEQLQQIKGITALPANPDGMSLAQVQAAQDRLTSPTPNHGVFQVPILMYHKTPADFESQLQDLAAKGYTTITLDELAGAFYAGLALPAKPVVITYDDGFSDQMTAFALLRKYNMKATYYIINGGPGSQYCIGSNRRPAPCGDAYLSWDEVRTLDKSGLITIAAHTVDHANLAGLSEADRLYQMRQSKLELEAQLGHPVHHLAYPYGAFSPEVIASAQAAGFVTAVSTIAGTDQALSNVFALKRVRDTYSLP